MQAVSPPTFRTRLFYLLLRIAIVSACIVAAAVSALDIENTRAFLRESLREGVSFAAHAAAGEMRRGEPSSFIQLDKPFSSLRGLRLLCVYNKDNRLIRSWLSQGYSRSCPALVSQEGLNESFSLLRIAEPVKSDRGYMGIVYAEGELLSGRTVALRASLVFLSFLLIALAVSAVAAFFGARHINHLLSAIGQQIECLKGNGSECLLPPASATVETMALYDEIRSLRLHLVASLVPRETVTHLKLWYDRIFSNLCLLVRHRVPADSSVHPILSDCELLLSLNADEPLGEPETADIQRIVDEAAASARILSPPEARVHLTVSFKSGDSREWMVQAGLLRALIRHLLLIALARTREGLIVLRLEIIAKQGGMGESALAWRLEDSGLPMQPGVLQGRLTVAPYKSISITEASWMLAVLLVKRFGGSISGENALGGLVLAGEIPLRHCDYAAPDSLRQGDRPRVANERPRLVLMVGKTSGGSRRLDLLLEEMDCRIVCAESYIQALELAPVLPFSAILFHEFLFSREAHAAVRQLLGLMEHKLMPTLPLWVVTHAETIAEQKAWCEAGVNELLSVSAPREKIASLCQGLSPYDARFWSVCDMNLLKEYSGALEARLPEMRAELERLIAQMRLALTDASADPFRLDVIHQAHGVKSAALALGYMALAALMANLEYMLAGGRKTDTVKNVGIIAQCLKDLCLR